VRRPFSSNNAPSYPIWTEGPDVPIRVLLVDDDKDEESLTRSLLARVERARYVLDWVPTFGEGLASIAQEHHDAYLIDHSLGARTGVELVREAREAGSLAPLIMLTGHRDRATDLAALDAGATDFLVKGRTDSALLDRTIRYSISHAAMVWTLDRLRNQMAGLEEMGRILVQEGPTPTTVERVVELIADRFGLAQFAIYLTDGDLLNLAGQRGYAHPVESVSRDDASVERVVHARQPLFIPSLTPDAGGANAGGAVATELCLPLMVSGDLMGLLNVASPVATPIGEHDSTAIRLIADRLTAALDVTRERRLSAERLAKVRRLGTGLDPSSDQEALIDSETMAYRRLLLEPLLEVAIATAGPDRVKDLGLLLVACSGTGFDQVARLAEAARAIFVHCPGVRFGEAELAVLVASTHPAVVRLKVTDLTAAAKAAGLDVWCGYASPATDASAIDVVAAAEAALAFARRIGPGTVIG
jgi:CheY-like chemotaxis protein